MKKIIVMIRTSTESQQVEDQHNEMVRFCVEHGYSKEQIIFVETQGASAFKVDEGYIEMIDKVKESIERDPDIDCFAVWHLNRAARNERVYVELKDFLVRHNVQFLVKNPYLKLLNEDGSINMGMELAFSLMATLSKQDNEERIAKFKRAKSVMKEQGRFIGGRCVKYGYKVGEGGYVLIDDEKASVVRLVFELYSTGDYSVKTLQEELSERGFDLSYHYINKMIADSTYVSGHYPPIISQELWSRCEDVRKKNYIGIPKGKRFCFGSGLFRCPVCGRGMVAEGAQYRCWHHNKYAAPPHCENSLTIRVDNMDGLLWWVASKEEVKYRMQDDMDRKREYEGKIEVLKQKIEVIKKKLEKTEIKKARINDLYVEGVIDKEELKKRQNKTLLEVQTYNSTILEFEEKIEGFLTLLLPNEEETLSQEKLTGVYTGVYNESDLEEMQQIVRRHIRSAVSTSEWFGKERDRRSVRQNAQLITIVTKSGAVKKFIYVARKYKGHHFFFYSDDGSERPVYSVKKIEREKIGILHPRAFKKIKDL